MKRLLLISVTVLLATNILILNRVLSPKKTDHCGNVINSVINSQVIYNNQFEISNTNGVPTNGVFKTQVSTKEVPKTQVSTKEVSKTQVSTNEVESKEEEDFLIDNAAIKNEVPKLNNTYTDAQWLQQIFTFFTMNPISF